MIVAKKTSKKHDDSGVLLSLSLALEKCDMDTVQHSLRVGIGAKMIMEEYLRKYSPTLDYSPQILQWAATLHDIGKSRVPVKVLLKPSSLTLREFEIIMKHTVYGEDILNELFDPKEERLMNCAHQVILLHHERYDGRGYPNHLKGEEIPLAAQFVGIADAFDALISTRVYKSAIQPARAYRMVMDGECGKFSEQLLSCLPCLLDEKTAISLALKRPPKKTAT